MKQKQSLALASLIEPLLAWYEQNRRPLPWRDAPTPYHVWLSEIMLQQTRIEAVIPYYERFLAAYPTVADLAASDDERLMKFWEGLGYYSRARNLKKAARCIVEQYGGELPADYEALRALPGIGAYTAGAIASISFGLPEPAVDGNVLRVVTRLTADESDITKESTKKSVTEALRAVYPSEPTEAAAMTQALMELGERVCVPNGEPRCQACPLGAFCLAGTQKLTDRIPVRAPKKPRRMEMRSVLLLLCDQKIALVKRPPNGLLAGLWEFPCLPLKVDKSELKAHLADLGIRPKSITPGQNAVHIFTHIEWHMQGYTVRCESAPARWQGQEIEWVTPDALTAQYAIPTAYRAYTHAVETLDFEHMT